jgi:tetratricopeptide (TPR) repeat protein
VSTAAPGGLSDERAVVCPSCGSRNKANWEFCVRCGEELAGAAVTAETLVDAAPESRPSSTAEGAAPVAGAGGGPSWLTFGVAVLVALIVWKVVPSPSTAPRGQDVFSGLAAPTAAAAPKALTPAAELFARGRRLLDSGDAAGAVRLIAQAVEMEPDNAVFRNGYARALWMSGARAAALTQYEQAARLGPPGSPYAADYARALRQEGRTPDAIRAFENVLAQTPDDVDILRELGTLLRETGAQGRSTELLRRAAALRPTDLMLVYEVARSLEASGDLNDAADSYRQILGNYANAVIARGRLAEVQLRQGQTDEALQTLEGGIAANPADAPHLRLLQASVLERAGRYREAIARYRDYAQLAGGAGDAKAMASRADELEQRVTEAEAKAEAKAQAAAQQASTKS